MKNKKVKKVEVSATSIAKDVAVCQNCKFHKNNPSFCKLKNSFTGRKNTCEEFKV